MNQLGRQFRRYAAIATAATLGAAICAAQEHAPERAKNPLAANAAALAAGSRLYVQACQACHGGEGRGDRGPALATSVFAHGSSDGELFLSIHNGFPGTQMPGFSSLKADQIWQLVTYLRSLSGSGATTAEKVAGNAGAGEALFFGKAACGACHGVQAKGGIVGPDLSAGGRFPADLLRRKILDPNTSMNPQARGRIATAVSVTTKDGRTLRGARRAEDSFSLLMTTADGILQRLDKDRLAEIRYEFESLMPPGYGARLNPNEIDDLVAYLKSQTGRDLAKTAQAPIDGGLRWERIRDSHKEPGNWLTYWGDYQGRHFSALNQITSANVAGLQAQWAAQMPGDSILESTPIVVDGIMYTSGSPGEVFALDARTGLQIWKYQRRQKIVNPYEGNRYNRGVAVVGNRVFFGTLDAVLIALDARTGLPLWEATLADTMQGYGITAAPLVVKDKVIVGVGGGEYGIRGFLDAYDVATGKRLWRFDAIPGPGEFGHDTWRGDSWKQGGGATWLTGSYDPELNLLYWTVGNPGPDFDYKIRKGDNLFTCSVVALDADTGKRKWHYQFTPEDSHDWDANEDAVLIDREFGGRPRKLLVQANRNGFYYVLDRTNGEFLLASPFVKQTWNAGFTKEGRPIKAPNKDAEPEGNVVYPGLGGGTNWQAPSYDPARGWLYLSTQDYGQRYVLTPTPYEPGKAYWGGRSFGLPESPVAAIKALDAMTGATKWQFRIAQGSLSAGVLATSGSVVFAATREGNLIALDSDSGKPLWRFQTGANIATSPMSYAVDGKQYVAVASGGVLYSFALSDEP